MAEKNKFTKRDKFEMLLRKVEGDEFLTEFINHEIELLSRKSKSTKPTPAQEDALAVADIIRDVLAESVKGMTVGAILKDKRIAEYVKADGNSVSSQMVTAILSKNPNDFVRTLDKKTALYSLNYGIEGEGEGD